MFPEDVDVEQDSDLDADPEFWDWAVRKQRQSTNSTSVGINDNKNSSIYVPLYVEIVPVPPEKIEPPVQRPDTDGDINYVIYEMATSL